MSGSIFSNLSRPHDAFSEAKKVLSLQGTTVLGHDSPSPARNSSSSAFVTRVVRPGEWARSSGLQEAGRAPWGGARWVRCQSPPGAGSEF